MARIQLSKTVSSSTLRDNVKVLVQTKAAWADNWTTQRYLTPISATANVAPGIGQASFRYEYGRITQPDKTSFSNFDPLELDGHFIRIKISKGSVLWTGVVTQEAFSQFGEDAAAPTGNQVITALEIGHILDRHAIINAQAKNVAGDNGALGWVPPVNPNEKAGLGVIGNMSTAAVSNSESAGITESRIYSDDGYQWTALEYIKYLLAWHHPPELLMDLSGQTDMLSFPLDEQHVEGLTLWQALEHLIPSRRGVGWTLRIDDDDILLVHIFSVLGEPLSVGNVTIEANEEKVTITDIDSSKVIDDVTLQLSKQQQYDRIEVYGERLKTCCSLSIEEGTLEAGWIEPEEIAYKAGDTLTPGSADANDVLRRSDRFENVYQLFRVPNDWDFKAGSGDKANPDGEYTYTTRSATPEVLEDGTIDIDGAPHYWRSGKSFLRTLPYTLPTTNYDRKIQFAKPVVFAKSGTQTRQIDIYDLELLSELESGYETPDPNWFRFVGAPKAGDYIVVSQIPMYTLHGETIIENTSFEFVDGTYTGHPLSNHYVTVGATGADSMEALRAKIEAEMPIGALVTSQSIDEQYYIQIDKFELDGAVFGCNIEVVDNEMALRIKPSINHQLALNHFDENTEPVTNTNPVLDYETIIATVAFETDQRLRVIAERTGVSDDNARVLTLDIDGAELWWIAPGTVTGVHDGALVHYWGVDNEGGILRDDSPMLRQIAALALAWYGKPRALLDITWKEITDRIAIGSYIEDVASLIDRRDVGTIVTKKVWNFGDSPTTSITTGYGQSSRAGRIDFPGMSGPRALAREIRRMRRDISDVRANISGLPVRYASGGGGGAGDAGADWQFLTMNGGQN